MIGATTMDSDELDDFDDALFDNIDKLANELRKASVNV